MKEEELTKHNLVSSTIIKNTEFWILYIFLHILYILCTLASLNLP